MGSGAMVVNNCPLCMNKQRRIDELEDEINSLRAALGREQRKMEDGFFGSSTPSLKKPFMKSTEKKEHSHCGFLGANASMRPPWLLAWSS